MSLKSALMLAIIALALLGLSVFALFLWAFPYHFVWQGPSPIFENWLDANKDGELSRAEWEVKESSINLSSNTGAVWTFIQADCDDNGRLTWSEYFYQVFKGKNCVDEWGQLVQFELYSRTTQEYPFPIIYTASQVLALREQVVSTALATVIKSLPAEIYEAPATEHEQAQVQLTCMESRLLNVPEGAGIYSAESHPAIECRVENSLQDKDLTLLVLNAKEIVQGQSQENILVKSVYIPHGESETITLYFSTKSDPLEVELRNVRLMPAVTHR